MSARSGLYGGCGDTSKPSWRSFSRVTCTVRFGIVGGSDVTVVRAQFLEFSDQFIQLGSSKWMIFLQFNQMQSRILSGAGRLLPVALGSGLCREVDVLTPSASHLLS